LATWVFGRYCSPDPVAERSVNGRGGEGYSLDVYQPLKVGPCLSGNGAHLNVRAFHPASERRGRSNTTPARLTDNLMHLYGHSEDPADDAVFPLIQHFRCGGLSASRLTSMPAAGDYTLYCEWCHAPRSPRRLSPGLPFRLTCQEAALALTRLLLSPAARRLSARQLLQTS